MPDNTCICCGRIIPEGRQICLACGDYDDQQRFERKVRTNGDMIRAMTNGQLCGFILTALSSQAIECDYCVHRNEVCSHKRRLKPCKIGIVKWLESEVKHE